MDKVNKRYLIVGIVFTLVVCIGFSVAFFTANISGDTKKVTINAGSLYIVFNDDNTINATKVGLDWHTSKTFSVENQSKRDFSYDINLEELINTFETYGYLQFRITSSDSGAVNMTDFEAIKQCDSECIQTLAKNITIQGGKTHNYTIEFQYLNDDNVNQSGDMGKTFKGKLNIVQHKPTLAETIGEKYSSSATKRETFSSIVEEGNVYYEDDKWTEDGSKVYYWAGNTEDNWVKFGSDESGNELWWRIIRTNEDGGLRLLYAGSSPTTEDAYISTMAYNEAYDNTTYVGYMYSTGSTLAAIRGNGTPSPIKDTLDSWYTRDLQTYDKYVSKTAIYCNDRSSSTGWQNSGTMDYNGITKFYTDKSDNSKNHPSFKCGVNGSGSLNTDSPDAERKKDMFSVSGASGGNGALTKPIGLITADEIVFAGGLSQTNNPDAYYYRNASGGSSTGTHWWWTMSPSSFDGSYAYVFIVGGSDVAGYLSDGGVNDSSNVVRPVVSLKSCVQLKGSGTTDSPYEVVEMDDSDTCAKKSN